MLRHQMRCGREQNRRAIGIGLLDRHAAQRAIRAAAIFNDDIGAGLFLQPFRKQPREHIDAAAGRERHHHLDIAIGKALGALCPKAGNPLPASAIVEAMKSRRFIIVASSLDAFCCCRFCFVRTSGLSRSSDSCCCVMQLRSHQAGIAHRVLDRLQFGAGRQVGRRLHRGRLDDAGKIHRHLHARMCFAGRLTAAIDDVLQRIDAALQIHCCLQIARLHRRIEIDDHLRNEGREADQRAIDALHHRRQQIFVMTGEHGDRGIGLLDDAQIARIFVHIRGCRPSCI